ncbi:hypothetical protein [Marinobacterium stanieri]|uniref:hypothetical protein n=1 Tax=Marinobacterium stanieri TaxID=49186 RepID=UPI0002558F14|nr:hypothetical protein [Marinobacterium stanieri]
MSLLGEIMAEAQSIVNDVLGHACTLTNTATGEETLDIMVVINSKIKLYQDGMFAGLVTTGTFDLSECDPRIGDELRDEDTGISYTLDGIKDETSSKRVFILGER